MSENTEAVSVGPKEVAEMYRRNAELGDVIFMQCVENMDGVKGLKHAYPDDIREKAKKLVTQSLDKLLAL